MRIGRLVRVLKDKDRNEIFNCAKDNRTLIISIFYPVDSKWTEERKPLYKDLFAPHADKFIKEWSSSEDEKQYIDNLTTNIYNNAPVIKNKEKYPVLIYSPSLFADRDSSIFLIEKLVEEGYIVITLGSVYETEFTIMPDGKIIEMSDVLKSLTLDSEELWKELVDIRKKDILFLLKQLDYINGYDEVLKERLNVENIGLIGFSIGTQAAVEAAADDKRIKAVVLLEGCLQDTTVIERVKNGQRSEIPHLLIKRHASSHKLRLEECYEKYEISDHSEEAENLLKVRIKIANKITETQKALYEFLDGYKSFVKIEYTNHMTFNDTPVLLNEKYSECLGGKILIKTAHEIISTVTLKFLNEFLCGRVNEYQNFITDENPYAELKVIDGDGEII